MAVPDNLPDAPAIYTWVLGALTLLTGSALIVWKFFGELKRKDPPADSKVILERAEIADLNTIRELAREMRPGLERLARVESLTAENAHLLRDIMGKFDRMERDAQVAHQVREEMARRLLEERQSGPYRRRARDDIDN